MCHSTPSLTSCQPMAGGKQLWQQQHQPQQQLVFVLLGHVASHAMWWLHKWLAGAAAHCSMVLHTAQQKRSSRVVFLAGPCACAVAAAAAARYLEDFSSRLDSRATSTRGAISVHINSNEHTDSTHAQNWIDFDVQWCVAGAAAAAAAARGRLWGHVQLQQLCTSFSSVAVSSGQRLCQLHPVW